MPHLYANFCSGLLRVAPYYVPGGVRVVSIEVQSCSTIVLTRNEHPKDAKHLAGHLSIQLTLDRYSHRIPRALVSLRMLPRRRLAGDC
jgi:hypothetical protein